MKYTHVPGGMQPWDEFHESPCIIKVFQAKLLAIERKNLPVIREL
jgi:hypothetical protein